MYLTGCPERLSELGSSLSVKLQPGELFLSIAATVGKPCITAIKACIHDGFVYFPQLSIPNKFLYYVFIGGHAYAGLGKLGTQLNLNTDTVARIKVALGTEDEVSSIVEFLDYETAKIDALIEKQQQLIALLGKKRQAVISHAVTKGLNPDAPMRDSGVEWLGEVPEHWDIKKLGHLGQVQNGLNIGGEAFGSGDPFVSYGDVYNNANIPETPSGLVRSTTGDQQKCSLQAGDVLFTRTSETVDDIGVASTCLRSMPRSTFAGFLIRFRPNAGAFDPNYSTYLFRNESVQGHFSGTMNIVTRASLSQDVLKQLPICLPPISEQVQIARHLASTGEVFDELESKLDLQRKVLKERRTALISAAVTGKIDVRGWKPPSSVAKQETEMEVA